MAGRPKHLVGIGASAGGLDAIEKFFAATKPDSGMAYVVIQHLSPNFKSMMNELLARHTEVPIVAAEDGLLVQTDHIYLIPPRINLRVHGGRLVLEDQDKAQTPQLPIDVFFQSLAEEYQENAIAVVLSGSGSDGTRGLKAVSEAGGLVVVQDLESSRFDGMPRSAITTGLADVVCRPHRMAARIAEYAASPSTFVRGESDTGSEVHERSGLFGLLRTRFGIDFDHYKPTTIHRRIERRMQLLQIEDLGNYTTVLERDPSELETLYRDLLVEVTHFFRDREAFDCLRFEVAPELIQSADGGIRAWVPGCATGEEAYSLAMILHHTCKTLGINLPIRVIATDVHKGSLALASAAIYEADALKHLPDEYRLEYFTKSGERYHLNRDIRGLVLLAPHDLTSDPPFTKLDLVSCRNVLIYLKNGAQDRVLSGMHLGLRIGGVLFLGPSESLGDLECDYESVNQHWRVFRKIRNDKRPTNLPLPSPNAPPSNGIRSPFRTPQEKSHGAIPTAALLNRYVPPSLLVDQRCQLIHCFGNAREYLQHPEGEATLDVLQLVSGDLRTALSAGLHRANTQNVSVSYRAVRVTGSDGDDRVLDISVEPIVDLGETQFIIGLNEVDLSESVAPVSVSADVDADANQRITDLEQALAYTRESLQATVEELESSNEELQSTNEELIASNEELHSANEELHSANEELYTVNSELERKIEQYRELQGDMELLLDSSNIGTIFLDDRFRIRRFTGSITTHFDLVAHDVGRKLTNFSHRLGLEGLHEAVEEVARSGGTFERSVIDDFGNPLMVKLVRASLRDGSRGVLVNIISPSHLQELPPRTAMYVKTASGYWEWPDVKDDMMFWSTACYSALGYEVGEIEPKFSVWKELVHPEDRSKLVDHGTLHCAFVRSGALLMRMQAKGGEYKKFEYRGLFDFNEDGSLRSMIGAIDELIEEQGQPTE